MMYLLLTSLSLYSFPSQNVGHMNTPNTFILAHTGCFPALALVDYGLVLYWCVLVLVDYEEVIRIYGENQEDVCFGLPNDKRVSAASAEASSVPILSHE